MIKSKSKSKILLSNLNKKSQKELSKSHKSKKSQQKLQKQPKKKIKNTKSIKTKNKNNQYCKVMSHHFEKVFDTLFKNQKQSPQIKQRAASIKLIQRPVSRMSTRRGSVISSKSQKQTVNPNLNPNCYETMKQNNRNLHNLEQQQKQIVSKQQKKEKLQHCQKNPQNKQKQIKLQSKIVHQNKNLSKYALQKQNIKKKSHDKKIASKKDINNKNTKAITKLQMFQKKMSKCLDQKDLFSSDFYAQSKKSPQKNEKLQKSKLKSKSRQKNWSNEYSSTIKGSFDKQQNKQKLYKVYQFYKQTFDINLNKCVQMNKSNRNNLQKSHSKSSMRPLNYSNGRNQIKKSQIKDPFQAQFGIIKHSINNTTNFNSKLSQEFENKIAFKNQETVDLGISKNQSSQYDLIAIIKESSMQKKLKKQIQLSKSKSSSKKNNSLQNSSNKILSLSKSKQIPSCKMTKSKYFKSIDMGVDIGLKFQPQKSNILKMRRKSSKDMIYYHQKDQLSLAKIQIGSSNIDVLKWWTSKEKQNQNFLIQKYDGQSKKLKTQDLQSIYKPKQPYQQAFKQVFPFKQILQTNNQNSIYEQKQSLNKNSASKQVEVNLINNKKEQNNPQIFMQVIQSIYTLKNNQQIFQKSKSLENIEQNVLKNKQILQQKKQKNNLSFSLQDLSSIDVFDLNQSTNGISNEGKQNKYGKQMFKINNFDKEFEIEDFQL